MSRFHKNAKMSVGQQTIEAGHSPSTFLPKPSLFRISDSLVHSLNSDAHSARFLFYDIVRKEIRMSGPTSSSANGVSIPTFPASSCVSLETKLDRTLPQLRHVLERSPTGDEREVIVRGSLLREVPEDAVLAL